MFGRSDLDVHDGGPRAVQVEQISKRRKIRIVITPLLIILGGTLFVLVGTASEATEISLWNAVAIGSVALVIIAILCYYYIAVESLTQAYRRAQFERSYSHAVDAARKSKDFSSLLDVNQKLLERYHDISTGQARQSFRSGQLAMVIGGSLILIGGALALAQNSTAGKATVAALTAIGSAISAYIAKTFLRSYEISVKQAERYFREPLILGYLLAAERIAGKIPNGDQQTQALAVLVQGVLNTAVAAAKSESTTKGDSP